MVAKDAYAAVAEGYRNSIRPLDLPQRTFEDNVSAVRTSDVVIAAQTIPTVAGAIATCGDGENLRIEHLAIANSSASAVTIRFFVVADGDSASDTANMVFKTSLAANSSEVAVSAVGCQLIPGDRLMVNATTGSVTNVAGRLTRITQGSAT